ncbi:MAG: ABC transporter ATP-binding protein [Planctomycetes bacterium]|nr:ABC transporter ATP-binding protein [Planctomycetota bacterium]
MNLKQTLPEAVAASLSRRTAADENVRFALRTDLTPERNYGPGYLIVTDGHVAVAGADEVTAILPMAQIKEVRIDELFSSSCLVAILDGDGGSREQDNGNLASGAKQDQSDPASGAEQDDSDGDPASGAGEKRLVYCTKTMMPELGALTRAINDLKRGKTPEVPEDEGPAECPKCHMPLPERGARCPACVPRFAVFGRLLKMLRPYRMRVRLLMALTFLAVASQMVPPYVTKRITDDVIIARNPLPLLRWILVMLGCWTMFLIAQCVAGMLSSWLAARLTADLRSRLHAHLQRLEMSYFGKREAGDMVSRVMRDTSQLQNFLIDGMPFLLVNSIMFVAIAVILLWLDVYLALLVFLPVPFIIAGVKWYWARLIPLFHKAGSRFGGLYSILGESIRGIKAIKAASDEDGRAKRFDKMNTSLFHTGVRIEWNWVGFEKGSFWIMRIGVTAVWFLAARRIAAGEKELTMGILLAFVGYIWMFYGPLQWFTVVLNWMSHAFAGAERIFAVLDTSPEVYEAPDAIHLERIRGEIRFEDVHFSYERGKEVIKGVNLAIAPGEMIGLVGKSGAGKSTIINLICRFYDVDSGTITIDGHPIRRLRLRDLRTQIGIVMQEPFLFRASILENIRYGSPDVSFEDIVRAAKAANAHGFIVDKEYGYDTVIGEGAEQLSVGEKQRVAIARAILYDPPILILDEATSSVDSETEQAIQVATARLVENRTTIAIAHRLATLRNANRLVVVEDGKIVEVGTHDELIASGGIYAGLVKVQTDLNQLRSKVWEG